ncbi:hypothetical protein [Maridesulfovibrio bastinii]|uniref:hypothetical protein n=1 Tax=Maridesulfovibrio bastinii TaxID=47157 RepID=UPI0004872114|nr:hypothetical protein [Maridesulfovibrio bastinii]
MINPKIYPAVLFIMVMLSAPSVALSDIVIRTDNSTICKDERIDFGTAEIKCYQDQSILSSWICNYDMGYVCKNSVSGEIRKGGFIPKAGDLCSHLCGGNENDWK